MKNLPAGIPDRDNIVYYDTEREQFYIIQWEDGGNSDIPHRKYIPKSEPKIIKRTKKNKS